LRQKTEIFTDINLTEHHLIEPTIEQNLELANFEDYIALRDD